MGTITQVIMPGIPQEILIPANAPILFTYTPTHKELIANYYQDTTGIIHPIRGDLGNLSQ